MPEPVSPLMLQFLGWVAERPRSYAHTMDAWPTSCPRLSIWEDALAAGLIELSRGGPPHGGEVALTPRGKAILNGTGNENSGMTRTVI